MSNTYNKVSLESDNETYKESITNSESEIVKLTKELGKFEKDLEKLEKKRDDVFLKRNNDVDKELLNTNPTLLQREVTFLLTQKNVSQTNADGVSVVEPSQFYDEDQHKELKGEMANLQGIDVASKYEKTQREKLIKQFEEGTVCPTCNRALEAYERNKLRKERYQLEIEQKQLEIDDKQKRLDNYESNKKKLEDNQKIDAEVIALKTKIETANGDIRQTNSNIEKHTNNITNMNEKIGINEELIKKITAEEELAAVFKIYLTVYGKNGISKIILKNMIPLINQELYRLLVDSCHFILEMNINDKNEVEFIMIDTETRIVKPLNAGSGYERTISSLALRSVLTKISSLPKPNIVVMDEVFGKIADENLEMVGEFFKKIKNYFDHILVISHNSLIRNWSDNIIMIKKEENVSSVDFITTKIS